MSRRMCNNGLHVRDKLLILSSVTNAVCCWRGNCRAESVCTISQTEWYVWTMCKRWYMEKSDEGVMLVIAKMHLDWSVRGKGAANDTILGHVEHGLPAWVRGEWLVVASESLQLRDWSFWNFLNSRATNSGSWPINHLGVQLRIGLLTDLRNHCILSWLCCGVNKVASVQQETLWRACRL